MPKGKVPKKTIRRPKNRAKTKIPPAVQEMSDKREKLVASNGRFSRIQLRDIYRLCLAGYTDKELCELFRVSYDQWKALLNPTDPSYYADLEKTLFMGRDGATAQVARSLYKRANGWSHPATKFFMDPDGNIVSQDYTERYPGDVRAQEIILKNRRPNDWKDKQEIRHTGENVAPMVNIITDEETVKKLMKLQNEEQDKTQDDEA